MFPFTYRDLALALGLSCSTFNCFRVCCGDGTTDNNIIQRALERIGEPSTVARRNTCKLVMASALIPVRHHCVRLCWFNHCIAAPLLGEPNVTSFAILLHAMPIERLVSLPAAPSLSSLGSWA